MGDERAAAIRPSEKSRWSWLGVMPNLHFQLESTQGLWGGGGGWPKKAEAKRCFVWSATAHRKTTYMCQLGYWYLFLLTYLHIYAQWRRKCRENDSNLMQVTVINNPAAARIVEDEKRKEEDEEKQTRPLPCPTDAHRWAKWISLKRHFLFVFFA